MVACVGKTGSFLQPAPVTQPGPATQWSKTFVIPGGGQGHSVQQTSDGGYIVCGNNEQYGVGTGDILLIKTDADGNTLWDKAFRGINGEGNSVQPTKDGGYIICGSNGHHASSDWDIWLIKTDIDGNKLWDKTFDGKEYGSGKEVKQTTDGGYIVCGITSSEAGNTAMWLIKTDTNGNKLWDKRFIGDDLKTTTTGYSVQENAGGGYIVCGEISSDILLIKTDAEGNMAWNKTFINGSAPSVQQTADGGYVICGRTHAHDGAVEAWLIKTDTEGNKQWDKTFTSGQKGLSSWDGDSAKQTSDGGYIICGTRYKMTSILPRSSSSYIWLVKTDADGNKLWDLTYPNEGSAWGNSVQQTEDVGYIVCGATGTYGVGGGDILLIKIAPVP